MFSSAYTEVIGTVKEFTLHFRVQKAVSGSCRTYLSIDHAELEDPLLFVVVVTLSEE